jgi:hypothetical protein
MNSSWSFVRILAKRARCQEFNKAKRTIIPFMEWYYAVGGERKGPVGEEEFQRLIQQGAVTSQTLVWREGMTDWQPHGGATPPPMPGNATGGGVVCAGCRGIFPGSEVVSVGAGLYCGACKPLALQRIREGESGTTAAEATRKEHLKHEASVKSIGFLYYLGGAAVLLIAIGMLSRMGGVRGTSAGAAGPIFMSILLLILGAGQLWVGTGLRGLRKWARIPTGILSGIGLLGFPLGTIINAYILYLIFSEKGKTVFSDEYQTVMEQTPHIKYRTSIIVWILLALVVGLIALGLIAAFFSKRG